MSFGKSGPHVNRLESGSKTVVYNLRKARLHSYVASEKSFGNATHIIETENFLILVDAQYTIPYAKEFRNYVDSLNKVIAGVIISHAHPDHYFGLTTSFSDVKSYALQEVINDIKEKGAAMIQESKPMMKDLIPDNVTIPTTVLHPGEITIDNLKIIYTKYDNAEADTQVVIELPEVGVVILQDLIYNNYHAWLNKNSIGNWLKLLPELKNRYKKDNLVLVGHGNPAGPGEYDKMIGYLSLAQELLEKGDKDELKKSLISKYPNYRGRKLIDIYSHYL